VFNPPVTNCMSSVRLANHADDIHTIMLSGTSCRQGIAGVIAQTLASGAKVNGFGS